MIALFFVLAVIAAGSAIAMVFFKNPIHSALALVVNLVMVACFFAMLDAHFLAATQIVVYAGAIMVLVLFMLMLLNLKSEARTRRETAYAAAAALFAIGFLVSLVPLLREQFGIFNAPPLPAESAPGTVEGMGIELYTNYVFLFQAAGMLLMTALVGAIMLAKRSYR